MNLEELYDEQSAKVYKFFYIQCLNRMVAEDLTSQTFMALIEKSKGIDIKDAKKYLYGIMRKIWLQYLREKYETIANDLEAIEDFEAHAEMEVNAYETADESARLRTYVEKLPHAQRTVVVMRHYNNQSNQEVATILGKDVNYVKVTYKRGIKTLRRLITQPQMILSEGVTE
jgi:RNA polymerase sigma-70 factor (ECF subfamily)